MQIKHWFLIASLISGTSLLAACGEEKKAEEAAPAAAGEAAPAAEESAPAAEESAPAAEEASPESESEAPAETPVE